MSKPVFSDLFTFSGRRNRKSYFLFILLFVVLLGIVWGIAGADQSPGFIIIASIVTLVLTISSWAVSAQRCRDFGWTGWAVLITLLPFVGWIFALAIIFVPGNIGPNRYGPDPLALADEAPVSA